MCLCLCIWFLFVYLSVSLFECSYYQLPYQWYSCIFHYPSKSNISAVSGFSTRCVCTWVYVIKWTFTPSHIHCTHAHTHILDAYLIRSCDISVSHTTRFVCLFIAFIILSDEVKNLKLDTFFEDCKCAVNLIRLTLTSSVDISCAQQIG